jgi:penicillin amidase
MVDFDKIPQTLNPPRGYVVGANQIAAGPKYFEKYAGQFRYREGYRARRLSEVLAAGKNLTAEDMTRLQADTKSIRAEDFVPHLLKALEAGTGKTAQQEQAYWILANWDYTMDKDKVAPTLFKAWMDLFRTQCLGDDWEVMGLGDRLFPQDPVLERLIRTDPQSHWFDDIRTINQKEDAADIMVQAFVGALAELQTYFQTAALSEWTWGRVHQAEFWHITDALDSLNYGPVAVSGSANTIAAPKNTWIRDGKIQPTHARRGAHHRLVVDFGNLANSRSVLPGGVSGLSTLGAPFDQFDLFINDRYHTEYFTATSPAEFKKQCQSITATVIFKKKAD